MMEVKIPFRLQTKKIQNKATDLYIKRQIPKKLYRLILEADYKDEKYIRFLMSLSEDLMRIKGYYRDPVRVEAAEKVLDLAIAEYQKED